VSHRLLSPEDLIRVTGKKRYSKQAEWFKATFGIDVVTAANGAVIMTWSTFESLQARRRKPAWPAMHQARASGQLSGLPYALYIRRNDRVHRLLADHARPAVRNTNDTKNTAQCGALMPTTSRTLTFGYFSWGSLRLRCQPVQSGPGLPADGARAGRQSPMQFAPAVTVDRRDLAG